MDKSIYSKDLLESIISTAIDGIIAIDQNGIIKLINSAAAELFQYDIDELIGKNIKMLMPEPHQTNHDQYIENYKKTGDAKIIGIGRQVSGLKKDGSQFPFQLAVSEVKTKNSRYFTGIIHDLTDIEQAYSQLKEMNSQLETLVEQRTTQLEDVINELLKANKQLEEKEQSLAKSLEKEKELNELKSRFVSMASHEFRTPLSTIKSSASIIEKYTKEEQQSNRLKHVNRIKNAVNNMTNILTDFLSLDKIEEGLMNVHIKDHNVFELLNETIKDFENLIQDGKSINLHSKDKDLIIKTDDRILSNIFINLISNALKYSYPNTTVEISLDKEDGFCKLQFSDKGIGIPKKDQKHLFEKFFRASNAENKEGTGLGLHIIKSYLQLLGGRISFVSVQNEGSTFTIYLPIEHE